MGVQQGVVGAYASGRERCGVDGTNRGQCAVWVVLDVGFDVVERIGGLSVGAGREDNSDQKQGYGDKASERHGL